MDMRLVKSFLTLSESKTYHEASAKLFISQPTLSKHIKTIENKLEITLFSRSNQGAILTEEGRLIYQHAKILKEQYDNFLSLSQSVMKRKCSDLNVAYTSSFINVIPDIANTFRELNPNVNLTIEEKPSYEQEKLLLNGQIDIGLMRRPLDRTLLFEKIGVDNLHLYASKNLVIESKNIEDIIKKRKLFTLDRKINHELGGDVDKILEEYNVNKNTVINVRSIYSILMLLKSEKGVTLLPNSLVEFLSLDLKEVKIESSSSVWDIGLCFSGKDNYIKKRFIEYILSKSNHQFFI